MVTLAPPPSVPRSMPLDCSRGKSSDTYSRVRLQSVEDRMVDVAMPASHHVGLRQSRFHMTLALVSEQRRCLLPRRDTLLSYSQSCTEMLAEDVKVNSPGDKPYCT